MFFPLSSEWLAFSFECIQSNCPSFSAIFCLPGWWPRQWTGLTSRTQPSGTPPWSPSPRTCNMSSRMKYLSACSQWYSMFQVFPLVCGLPFLFCLYHCHKSLNSLELLYPHHPLILGNQKAKKCFLSGDNVRARLWYLSWDVCYSSSCQPNVFFVGKQITKI